MSELKATGEGKIEEIVFKVRRDAGRRLASVLSKRIDPEEPTLILGIPRGG